MDNIPCRFPFQYNGVAYNGCTLNDADQGKSWCSTLVDENGNHVSGGGHYGDCGPKCPLTGRSTFTKKVWFAQDKNIQLADSLPGSNFG